MKSQLQSIYITWRQRIKLEEEQRRAPIRKSKKNQPARYAQIRHSIYLQESPGEQRTEDGGRRTEGRGKGMGGSETTDELAWHETSPWRFKNISIIHVASFSWMSGGVSTSWFDSGPRGSLGMTTWLESDTKCTSKLYARKACAFYGAFLEPPPQHSRHSRRNCRCARIFRRSHPRRIFILRKQTNEKEIM